MISTNSSCIRLRISPLFFGLFLFIVCFASCSKESKADDIEAVACLKIEQDTINFNDKISMENCSPIDYEFSLDGSVISIDELNEVVYTSGNHQISLKAFGSNGNFSYAADAFYVNPKEELYFLPEGFGRNTSLLDFGRNPIRDELYAIYYDFDFEKYYYAEISGNLEISLTEIVSRFSKRGRSALCDFEEDGTIYMDFPYGTTLTLQRQRHNVNIDTGISETAPIALVSYSFDMGYKEINDQSYSVGANFYSEDGTRQYRPAINTRQAWNTSRVSEIDLGERSGVVGNLIPFKNGYLGYGLTFDLVWADNEMVEKRPTIWELDTEFNVVDSKEFPVLSEDLFRFVASFDAPFHLELLPNQNILLYGLDSFRLLDNDLNLIVEESYGGGDRQSVLVLEEFMYVSGGRSIRKMDFNGNVVAEFEHGQFGISGIYPFGNDIIFAAELSIYNDTVAAIGNFFFGLLDTDLKLLTPDK